MTYTNNWETTKLEDVVEILDRMRIPVNQRERNKRIEGKPRNDLFPYYGANGQVGWIDDYIFDEKLVLLAEDGGFFDNPYRPIAYIVEGKCWVNNHAHVLRAREKILPDFLMYALNSTNVMPFVSGTTRLKLNQTQTRKILIPVPPLEVQRQIVEILTLTNNRTATTKKELSLIPDLTKRLRMAILSKTFGDESSNRFDDLFKISSWKFPSMPFDGKLVKFQKLMKKPLRNGRSARSAPKGGGIPVLKLNAIRLNDFGKHNQKMCDIDDVGLEDLWIKTNDILIARASGTDEYVGLAALYKGDSGKFIFPDLMIRARVDSNRILPDYTDYYLKSPLVREYFIRSARGTSSMGKISQKHINDLPIPLIRFSDQVRVVNYLDAVLPKINEIQILSQITSTKLNSIEQSILHRAFKGELYSGA